MKVIEKNIRFIGGNDLAVDFNCTCPSEMWKGTDIEHIMKERIHLHGYNDSNFWDNVNGKPRDFTCKCGKSYTQQWFRDGYVVIKEIDEGVKVNG